MTLAQNNRMIRNNEEENSSLRLNKNNQNLLSI